MSSKLYQCLLTKIPKNEDGTRADGYILVGAGATPFQPVIVHVCDTFPSPDPSATLLWDFADGGWGAFAAAYPTIAIYCTPHEWFGEAVASDVIGINDPRFFPNPQPTV